MTISTEDSNDLKLVLNEDILTALRIGYMSPRVKEVVKRVDQMIKDSPPLTTAITLYKTFTDAPVAFRDGGELEEPAFFAGSTVKPQRSVNGTTIAVSIPNGTKALELPDGSYVLARGLKIDLTPTRAGFIPASINMGDKVSMSSIFPIVAIQQDRVEFYNKNHDKSGKFSPSTNTPTSKPTTVSAPHHVLRGVAKVAALPIVATALILHGVVLLGGLILIHHHYKKQERKLEKELKKEREERRAIQNKANETEEKWYAFG